MYISNKMYDILKWVALLGLPALSVLYGSLASIWGLPYGEQVVGTFNAIALFIGAVLGISSTQYNKTHKPN